MDVGARREGDGGAHRARDRSDVRLRVEGVDVRHGYSIQRRLQQLARSRAVEERSRKGWFRKR